MSLGVLTGLEGLPPGLGHPQSLRSTTNTAPSPFLFAQFLLDGEVLSLADFQVSAVGRDGSDGSEPAKTDSGGCEGRAPAAGNSFQGEGLPGQMESGSCLPGSSGWAEVLPWL